VSNTAHSIAKLAIPGAAWDPLWEELKLTALARVPDFNPQDMANTAWAFAKAGHAAPELFDAIAAGAARRVGEFNPQNLANTA